ncbi:MAG: iron-containing redox enzyme family protein [Gammaproteobacteria bacterium]
MLPVLNLQPAGRLGETPASRPPADWPWPVPGSPRRWYFELHDIEHDAQTRRTAWQLATGYLAYSRATPDREAISAHAQWPRTSEEVLMRCEALATEGLSPSRETRRFLCCQYAPSAFAAGAALRHLGKLTGSGDPTLARLHRLYVTALRARQWAAIRAYRAALEAAGVELPAADTIAFAMAPLLLEEAFLPAVLAMSISESPRALLPELLGITLAECTWLARRLSALVPSVANLAPGPIVDCVAAYLPDVARRDGEAEAERAWRRVLTGIRAHQRSTLALDQAIPARLEGRPSRSARAEMLALIRTKVRYARGHHLRVTLAGRALEDWLQGPDAELDGLLEALAGSTWIDRQHPANSRFLTELTSAGGPMFRVFTAAELETVLAWIANLDQAAATRAVIGYATATRPSPIATGPHAHDARPRSVRGPDADPRLLFHGLLNWDRYPEVLPAARTRVERCLAKTRSALARPWLAGLLRPFEYSATAFESRVLAIYERAVSGYRPLQGEPRLTQAQYLWILTALAPLILVDGCWLRGIDRLILPHPRITELLWPIYRDEIGAGDAERSHAGIFRRLLEQHGIILPPVDTYAFASDPRCADAAFALPVFFLGVSEHNRDYLPELLGLNLAIELSGLGAFYIRTAEELAYRGLDPAIVKVHISSDNLASGHAALAKAAIITYLDEVRSRYGEAEMQSHWRRVWCGYMALQVLARQLALGVTVQFARRCGPVGILRLLLPARRRAP